MRLICLVFVGLAFTLAGCCGSHDAPAPSAPTEPKPVDTESKSTADTCPSSDDCCSAVTRSSVLKKAQAETSAE